MMQDMLRISDEELDKIINIIQNKEKNEILIISRKNDDKKNPYNFFTKIGIDIDDAKDIIKSLTKEDFEEIIVDTKNKFVYLYVFKKKIENINGYIKIGFKYNDITKKLCVVSFHEDF